MRPFFPLTFLFPLFLFSISQAKVFFHSDFECGETYLQEEIKPGAKKIKLIANHRLQEWPANGGQGIIEGNLPPALDSFSYKARKGNILKGVSGINKPHPVNAGIRTGNLAEWTGTSDPGKGIGRISSRSLLFGNYCAVLPCSLNAYEELKKQISWNVNQLYFRFYVRFSLEFLNQTRDYNPIFVVHIRGYNLMVVWAVKGEDGKAWLTMAPQNEEESRFARKEDILLLPDEKYLIECNYVFSDTNQANTSLWVNGRERIKCLAKCHKTRVVLPDMFYFDSKENESIQGKFYLDEVIVSDSLIGGIPEKPQIQLQGQYLTANMSADLMASHWQISRDNTWLLPLFTSGEDKRNLDRFFLYAYTIDSLQDQPESYLCQMPTGVRPDSAYFARVRQENRFGNWSDWSVPEKFKAEERYVELKNLHDSAGGIFKAESIYFAPNGLSITKVFFAEIGKNRPLGKIRKGQWYDFYVYLFDPALAGFSNIGYADIWLQSDPENNLGNYINRGGKFSASNNYMISLDFANKWIYAKQNEGSDQWASFMPQPIGLYADERHLEINLKEGWARVRLRLLKEAQTGPFLIKGFAVNQQFKLSPMYSRLIVVADPLSFIKFIHKNKISLAGVLLLLLGTCIAVYCYRKIQARKKRASKKESEASREKPDIVPLEFDSPYDENIKKAKEFILMNYDKNISSVDVATAINVTPAWLSKFFHKGTKKTVMQYINEVRLEHAKKLLRETKLSITEIAFKTGFGSLNHFYINFTKNVKMPPKDYRETSPQQSQA